MSANRDNYSDEEERMVTRVGGRARGLVQVVRRIQRERERAGQTLLNLQEAPNVLGQVEMLERRLGGLQTLGRRSHTNSAPETMTEPDSQQTRSKESQWTRVRARARPNTPSQT